MREFKADENKEMVAGNWTEQNSEFYVRREGCRGILEAVGVDKSCSLL